MSLTELLSDWMTKIETENPPPAGIAAMNFGMLNTDKGYMVYVTGAEEYDPDDDEWAGEIDYQPARAIKYCLLPKDLTKGQKWRGVLEMVAAALKELAAAQPDRILFKGRALTAGYDDYELTLIRPAQG